MIDEKYKFDVESTYKANPRAVACDATVFVALFAGDEYDITVNGESEYSLRKAVLNNDEIEAKLKADLLTRKWFFVHHKQEEEVKHDDISANELLNLAIQNEGLNYILCLNTTRRKRRRHIRKR